MNDISVFCHEFGHMLGLPDLYARPEKPGSEGVGSGARCRTRSAAAGRSTSAPGARNNSAGSSRP